ncbi:MAG: acetyl-CoA carboxylase biotin carboxyl carrier protein [Planctomycetes bacterium]|nr:acetyl-CoA carboxylase biotin carboxyl carrier protein [Planctomycetota bacterium]
MAALMNLDEIKKLLELMDANKVVELEVEEEGKKIRLRRADGVTGTLSVLAPPAPPVPLMQVPGVSAAASLTAESGAAAKRPENMAEIKSPLVGTFYRAPKPDADPYVNVGDEVGPEKVLCIVEAMKVMNEIKAEMHGIVREILVKNGQAVEFGELLFVIEKK